MIKPTVGRFFKIQVHLFSVHPNLFFQFINQPSRYTPWNNFFTLALDLSSSVQLHYCSCYPLSSIIANIFLTTVHAPTSSPSWCGNTYSSLFFSLCSMHLHHTPRRPNLKRLLHLHLIHSQVCSSLCL